VKYADNSVIEVGSESVYGYKDYFYNIKFIQSNPFREDFLKLDVTNIQFNDNEVDNYLCISVFEHVFDIPAASREIYRTLKPGGFLFLVIPFAYPIHDEVDYWRLLPKAYEKLFHDFEIIECYHLGAKFSSTAEVLKRPRGKIVARHIPSKLIGWGAILFSKLFDRMDGFPQGYGYILKKK
jgi:SAM-dependent methyltransferase